MLVGCICHQNIYDLVQIWDSDKAMHRHESTTLFLAEKKWGVKGKRPTKTRKVALGTLVLLFGVEYEEKQQ